tara:strand:+ start:1108 stop:1572 length:465 start_codon:yes stop_codon:yes gene_type:complete
MKNKIITILLIFFFLLSCGYTPILTQKELPFKIENIQTIGNKKINSILSKKLRGLEDESNVNKKTFDIILETNLTKLTISKDSKGDPTIFEIQINTDLKVFNNKENINIDKNILKKITYNNIQDKFELERYEDTLIENLSINIADRIISILSNL